MVEPARRTPLKAVHSADGSRNSTEELPYRIELRGGADEQSIELLACARSSSLARAIFDAACKEYLDRNVFLSRGSRVIAKRLG
jgi:hypothetical protein